MKWMLIGVAAIFLVCFITGICRGGIRIAVSLGATILTLVLVFFATPYVAKGIAKYTPLDQMIERQVVNAMTNTLASLETTEVVQGMSEATVKKALEAAGVSEEKLQEYGISVEDIVNGVISKEDLESFGISGRILDGLTEEQQADVGDALTNVEIPRDMQIAALKKADLPDVFKSLLTTNNNNAVYEELGVSTFAQYVAGFLAKLIINILSFLATFVVVTIIVRAIVFALDFVSELPVLGAINRLAGGAVGILVALTIVWTIFVIVTLLYTTDLGREMYLTIQGNTWLKLIYDYNPIMKLATIFR